jgi:hypothetical protein
MSEVDFSWVEPLNPTIWNLFDIGPQMPVKTHQIWSPWQGSSPSFDAFLTVPPKPT